MHTGPVLDVCWSDVRLLIHHLSCCHLYYRSLLSAERYHVVWYVVLFEQDGSKVFTASCDKTAKMWDLNSNQAMQIAQVRMTLLSSNMWFVELNRMILNPSYFLFTAWWSNQVNPLDKSTKLQLCHDRQLGQNIEGPTTATYTQMLLAEHALHLNEMDNNLKVVTATLEQTAIF